jgi:hypothetical protein
MIYTKLQLMEIANVFMSYVGILEVLKPISLCQV